jgi:PIN domain nuclease of toxin-antitoxin system
MNLSYLGYSNQQSPTEPQVPPSVQRKMNSYNPLNNNWFSKSKYKQKSGPLSPHKNSIKSRHVGSQLQNLKVIRKDLLKIRQIQDSNVDPVQRINKASKMSESFILTDGLSHDQHNEEMKYKI